MIENTDKITNWHRFDGDTLNRFCELNAILQLIGVSIPGLPQAPSAMLYFKDGHFEFHVANIHGVKFETKLEKGEFYDRDLSQVKLRILDDLSLIER